MDGDEAKHALKILRCKIGDQIFVVDGCGTKYNVLIEKASRSTLEGKILSRIRKENEPAYHLTLAQAVCRQERMDFLIEKTTEIGVSSIIPILTAKGLVKVSGISKGKAKIDRWRRIAIAGMKQSLRTVLPEIESITAFECLLPRIGSYDLCLIASLEKDSKSLKECAELKRNVRKILLIVGPESGFSEEELTQTKLHGAIPITLGSRRLRTETAGIIFPALVLYQLGNLS